MVNLKRRRLIIVACICCFICGTSAAFLRVHAAQISAGVAVLNPNSSGTEGDQATRESKLRQKLSDFQNRANKPYDVMWGILHITIIVVCVILMTNTAKGTLNSRFIQYL